MGRQPGPLSLSPTCGPSALGRALVDNAQANLGLEVHFLKSWFYICMVYHGKLPLSQPIFQPLSSSP